MTLIRYTGSPGFALTGVGELEPGQEYDVSADRAKQLLKRRDFEPGTKTETDTKAKTDEPKEATP